MIDPAYRSRRRRSVSLNRHHESTDRRYGRLYARSTALGGGGRARGRRGFCNGKLQHEKVVKRGRTAWQGGDTDLNIDVEEQ